MRFAYRNVYPGRDHDLFATWSTPRRATLYAAGTSIGYEIIAIDPTHRKAPVVVMFVPRKDKP